MRTLWVAICCTLTAVNNIQAESYRSWDRDDGFNPMGMMREMPSPMNMFDSSDRRRDDYRMRRPPLYRPPFPGYPGMPYGYPPATVPYGHYPGHPVQSTQSNAARQGDNPPNHTAQQPTVPSVDTVKQPAPPIQSPQPAMPYDKEQQTGYSFRPMTPMQQDTEKIEAPFISTDKSYPPDTAPQTWITPPTSPPATHSDTFDDSREPALINGKPALFRPMHLGVETSAD